MLIIKLKLKEFGFNYSYEVNQIKFSDLYQI